jgi:hypothetical protein
MILQDLLHSSAETNIIREQRTPAKKMIRRKKKEEKHNMEEKADKIICFFVQLMIAFLSNDDKN